MCLCKYLFSSIVLGTEWALSVLKLMPFSLEIFLDYFKKLFLLQFSVFSYSCYLALEPPGLILCCFTMSALCSNFWEFPSIFIFPAFSSMIMFLLYRSSFVPLNVLFFLLITSCIQNLIFLKGVCSLASFLPSFLKFSFPNLIPFSSKLPFSACFGPPLFF